MKLLDLIAGVFKPAAELIDELHTSEEERLRQKARLLEVQATVVQQAIDYERDITLSKADIIRAEAQSESELARIWRPMVMLMFASMATADALGILPNPLAPEMWTLLQIGLGGYVVGRSGEKIIKTLRAPQG